MEASLENHVQVISGHSLAQSAADIQNVAGYAKTDMANHRYRRVMFYYDYYDIVVVRVSNVLTAR